MRDEIESKDELLAEMLGEYGGAVETRWYDGIDVSRLVTDDLEGELRGLLEGEDR